MANYLYPAPNHMSTPTSYDIKIINAVKALRLLRNINQEYIARCIDLSQSAYCKIETGQRALTISQLRIIAKELKTTHFQILAIADADDNDNFNLTSLSEILIKFVIMFEGKNAISFTEEELEMIISKIRTAYGNDARRRSANHQNVM